jgi:hypothetical protein
MKKERTDLTKMKVEHNMFPLFSIVPKKELEIFITCLELEVRDYYGSLQNTTTNIPP